MFQQKHDLRGRLRGTLYQPAPSGAMSRAVQWRQYGYGATKACGISGAKLSRYTVLEVVSAMAPNVRPWNPPCTPARLLARPSAWTMLGVCTNHDQQSGSLALSH